MNDDYTRSSGPLPRRAKWQPAVVFTYCDEYGAPVFHVHRQIAATGTHRPVIDEQTGKPKKRCFQVWETPDHKKPLKAPVLSYRLPELIKAVAAGETVFVAEGEPKVEALRNWGLAATCCAEGAGKWRAEHAAFLRDADVVILPDNDVHGRKHADQVGRSLTNARRRRLLALPDLPNKGDIVDWVKAGGTREQFIQLAASAPDWTPYGPADADALIFHGDADYEPPRWLIHERIPETGVGLLAGQFGMFKTFHAIDLVGAIVTEHEWLGRPVCRRGGVLFIAAEGAYDLPRRLAGLIKDKIEPQLKQSASTLIDPQRLPIAWKSRCLPLLSKDNTALDELIRITGDAQAQFKERFGLELVLIVFDTMAAVAGWKDENDNAEAQRAMTVLHQLSMATGAFVIAVDHYGKNPQGGARGASAREASADVVLAALGNREDDGQVSDTRLALRKARSGPSGLVFPFEMRTVELGTDDYDRPVTTLTINWDVERAEPDKPKAQSLTLLEQVMTELVTKTGETNGGVMLLPEPTVRTAFRNAYRQMKPDTSSKAAKEAFRRAVEAAKKSGALENDETNLWLTTPTF